VARQDALQHARTARNLIPRKTLHEAEKYNPALIAHKDQSVCLLRRYGDLGCAVADVPQTASTFTG